MAWMSEAEYELKQDSRDKKITARSARSTRTHCGKRGAVKFPSDYLTKKERDAMNGKCETYRLNAPMSWQEFKSMPEDLQKTYIKTLRKTYNVPNKALAEMFGVSGPAIAKYFESRGLSMGKGSAASKRVWNKEGFLAWRGGAVGHPVDETPVEEIEEPVEGAVTDELIAVNEEPEIILGESATECKPDEDYINRDIVMTEKAYEEYMNATRDIKPTMPVIPKNGTMSFENNRVDDILDTIRCVLLDTRVNVSISWEVVGE